MDSQNIVLQILSVIFLQECIWLGGTLVIGTIIDKLNNGFNKLLGAAALPVYVVTGIVGTPIHEASHALFCLIFGHKIESICFFNPSAPDGVLGYVEHSYKKNFYQRMGNFFIGVAPILVMSALLILLQRLLVPEIFANTSLILSSTATRGGNPFLNVLISSKDTFAAIFSLRYLKDWRWWVYIALAIMFGLHMDLSQADFKGCITGIVFVFLVLAIVPSVAALVDLGSLRAMYAVNEYMTYAGSYYLSTLMLGASFALLVTLIALLIHLVVYLIRKISNKD